MCARLEENDLGWYVRRSNEMLLKGLKKVGIVKTEFKNKWHEKRMH